MASDDVMAQFVEFQRFKKLMKAEPELQTWATVAAMAPAQAAPAPAPAPAAPALAQDERTSNLATHIRNILLSARLYNDHENSHVLNLIKLVINNEPSRLHDFRDLHNSLDGTRTYYSVRFKVHEHFSYALHIYGIKRFTFHVTSIEVLLRSGGTPMAIPIKPFTRGSQIDEND